jgi:hypothetical protein
MAALACLAVASSAPAQSTVPVNERFDAFRFILWQRRLDPSPGREEAFAKPAKSIVIVFGRTEILERVGSLKRFVMNGGALMVATDRKTGGALERDFGVRVLGYQIEGRDKTSVYRGSETCPLVQSIPDAKPALFPAHHSVASNRPSLLLPVEGSDELHLLAEFPSGCRVVSGNVYVELGNLRFPFAMGGDVGNGRVLILSDHSVFINGMMLESDNGNFDFAYNCVKWLSDSGRRSNVLFVDDDTIVTDFKVPLTDIAVPPISPLDAANHVIAALEEDDLFNKLILEQFSLRQIISAWALVLTVGLLLYVFYRLIRGGYHIDTQAPLLASGAGPISTVVEQRRQSLIRDGNLWEAARDVARQWFADAGYEPMESSSPKRPRRPQVQINARWWQRQRLRNHVSRLWRLAFSPRPQRVSKRDFDRLLSEIHDLEAAMRDGMVQIQQSGTTA